jgi:AraC-like DNA-binding protein
MLKYKKTIMPAVKIIVLLALPVSASVYYSFLSYKTDMIILPNTGNYMIYPYNDSYFQGNSRILGFVTGERSVSLEYRLDSSHNNYFPHAPYTPQVPYAGIVIESGKLRFLNLKGYDYIDIKVKDSGTHSILINLLNFDNKITKGRDVLSYVMMMYEFALNNTNEYYRLPLDYFQIPAFWYAYNNIHDHFSKYRDLSQILWLEIQSGLNAPFEGKAGFTISALSLRQDHPLLFIRIIAAIVLYEPACFFTIFLLQRKKAAAITIPYEKTAAPDRAGTEKSRIIDYLAAAYKEPDLSQSAMAGKLGIRPARIREILKASFKLGFKEYLNLVRISEAKRLLSSTDLSILEIAFTAGFNNVTHFNRTFRAGEGMTPGEFRRNAAR